MTTPKVKHYLTTPYGNVRKKCLLFVDTLKMNGYRCLPLEVAKDLFSEITGVYDQKSLKAYFGTRHAKSTRDIVKTARYASGATSFKAIRLTVNVPERKGYLEKLNLVSYEKRGQIWFMLVNELSISPTLSQRVMNALSPSNNSLSPTNCVRVEGEPLERSIVEETEKREREYSGRERNNFNTFASTSTYLVKEKEMRGVD